MSEEMSKESNPYYYIGCLQKINQDALHLRKILNDIKDLYEQMEGKATQGQSLKNAWENNNLIFGNSIGDVDTCITTIKTVENNIPKLFGFWSSSTRNIELNWIEIKNIIQKQPELININDVKKSASLLEKIYKECIRLILPTEVNANLEQMRVGEALDFNKEYAALSEKDRKEELEFLCSHSKAINGIIDSENGLIYPIAKDKGRVYQSSYCIIGLVALGYFIAWLVSLFGESIGFKTFELKAILITYTAIIVGAIIHVGMQYLKQYRKKSPYRLALDDIPIWIHVKEVPIIIELLVVLFIFIIGVYTIQNVDISTAFLLGYSYDSVFDVFALRFENVIKTKTESLTQDLKTGSIAGTATKS